MNEPFDMLALPFDQYQRYRAITQIADAVRPGIHHSPLTVVDVGGFFRTRLGQSILPLARFLPQDWVAAVDLVAEYLDNYAVASGMALPFSDAAFDMVVTCDTLEHITPDSREDFILELLRVARYCAVTIAPFDSEGNRRAEQLLHSYMTSQGAFNRQLQEHLRNGLPSLEDLRELLSRHELAFFEFADGYLPNWLAMMLVKHTPGLTLDLQLSLDRWYNKHFTPHDRREPSYRHVFVVAKPGNEELLPAAEAAAAASPSDAFPDPAFEADLGRVLGHARAAKLPKVAALEAENARLRQLVDSYEQGRFIQLMRRLHGWRQRLDGGSNAE